jgi:hypothetical protein
MLENAMSIKTSRQTIVDYILKDLLQRRSNPGGDQNSNASALEVAVATVDALETIVEEVYSLLAKDMIKHVQGEREDAVLVKPDSSILAKEGPIQWKSKDWPGATRVGFAFDSQNARNGYVYALMVAQRDLKDGWTQDYYESEDAIPDKQFDAVRDRLAKSHLSDPAFPAWRWVPQFENGRGEALLIAAGLQAYEGMLMAEWLAKETLELAKEVDSALGLT